MSKAPNSKKIPVRVKTEGNRVIYTCPKCGKIWTQRRKMHRNLCMQCGQYLDWTGLDNISGTYLICTNMEEAYAAALEYSKCNGTTYAVNIEKWRMAVNREWPKTLFFPFPGTGSKGYGRFMRWAAKNGYSQEREAK